MSKAIRETNFKFPGQTGFYRGKVRDVYEISDEILVMVATDRISAFDHILPEPIPYKGEILNLIAARALSATRDIVPNWLVSVPDPAVSLGRKCKPLPVEMVIRGYLVGHAWREYKAGKKQICGVDFPQGMKEFQKFPEPLITPTTKANEGHDEDISREMIIGNGIVKEEIYLQLEQITRKLFERGTKLAADKGLLLADTKYEFGLLGDEIILIDEVHTPDSSRYFYSENYEALISRGEKPRQLSKEFVREWLMDNGFQGKEGQKIPLMTPEVVDMIRKRYLELFEKFTGEKFEFSDRSQVYNRLETNIKKALESLKG